MQWKFSIYVFSYMISIDSEGMTLSSASLSDKLTLSSDLKAMKLKTCTLNIRTLPYVEEQLIWIDSHLVLSKSGFID